jgi:hypothetical protein
MATATSDEKLKDIREAIESGMRGKDIRELLHTSAGTITNVKRAMGLPIRPMRRPRKREPVLTYLHQSVDQVALPVPMPEEYVTAFENRVVEYRTLLWEKDCTIERLKKENAKLLDEYSQRVFQLQNWQGPTSIMNQSLGNGG